MQVPTHIPPESSDPKVLEEYQIDVVNELFLWSVLNGYQKLSLWLWDKSYGDESFIRVLIGEEVNLQIKRKMEEKNIPMQPTKFNENYEYAILHRLTFLKKWRVENRLQS